MDREGKPAQSSLKKSLLVHKATHMKSEVKTKICITVKSIFFDFTGRPLVTADYLTHTYIGYKESRFLSRVTGST